MYILALNRNNPLAMEKTVMVIILSCCSQDFLTTVTPKRHTVSSTMLVPLVIGMVVIAFEQNNKLLIDFKLCGATFNMTGRTVNKISFRK